MDTGMGMDGAITAVAATTTVGTAATTMDGGIIAIGGELHVKPKKREAAVVGGLRIYRRSEAEFVNPAASLFFHMPFIISSRWREVFGALSSKPTG